MGSGKPLWGMVRLAFMCQLAQRLKDAVSSSVYKGLFRGAAWTMIMRWSMRLIGFVNILILARLLEPADFGILAMSTAVIGFARSFTEMGAQQLLIRSQNVDRADIDSAWTIHVLQGLVVAALVFAVAGPAASYFNDPRIEPAIRVLALLPLVNGLTNIGLVLARKELNFALDFRARVLSRVATFVVTLALVLSMRDYWALIYGTILGEAIAVVISFLMHPYRPRLCFSRLGPYFRFAGSIIPMRIAKYGNVKAGLVVAGGVGSTTQLGIYNMGLDLTKLLTSELSVPLAHGLFPGYAKIGHDHQQLAKVFANVFATINALLVPMGIGLGLVATDLVPLVLGDKWLAAIPYVQWFSIALVVGSINELLTTSILIVAGFERRSAILLWFRLCTYVPTIVLASRIGGVDAIVRSEVFYTLCFFPICVIVLTRSIPITAGQILDRIWRPLLSAAAMTVVVLSLNQYLAMPALLRLAVDALAGAATYVTVLYGTWRLVGSPEGIERLVNDKIVKRLKPSRGVSGPAV